MAKRITIVGGGYAGTALARALDGTLEVTLVEPRDRFVHNVAAIRAVADPSMVPRIMLPYDRLLRSGTVRRGTATAIAEGAVTLADGSVLESDIVVVATGSRYAQPFKPLDNETSTFTDANRAAHAAVEAARAIAIVGGGAVGVELAGELSTTFPKKDITLVAATPALLPGYAKRLSDMLAAQLRAKGVSLRLGATVGNLANKDAPFAGRLESDAGPIDADLIFPAVGARPINDLLRGLPGSTFDNLGRAHVDGWLRPAGAKMVFALGDAVSIGDAMTIVSITRQAPWLAKAIKALVSGRNIEAVAPYKPWPVAPILVPLGPKDGASLLPFPGKGLVVGRHITAMIKGKDLFVSRYRKDFGQTAKR
jgi:apoptosis-inducing factor 2